MSNWGTPAERISEFVDYHINPIVKVLRTVLRDTLDFLRTLEELGLIPEIAMFGTIDVVGLYPNIPHEDGLESMRKVLSEFKEIVNVSEWYVNGVGLIEMTTIILENNYFEFDGIYIGKSRGQLLVLSLPRPMPIYLCMFWRQEC